jgi:hypothetical protein
MTIGFLRYGTNPVAKSARKQCGCQEAQILIGLICGILICTLIGFFSLQPFMAALREAAGLGGVMTSDAKMQFGISQGISSAFYLIESLLGIALLSEYARIECSGREM